MNERGKAIRQVSQRITKKASAGLWAALIVLAAVRVAAFHSMTGVAHAGQWVAHTEEVLRYLNRVDAAVATAVAGERAYLISPLPGFRTDAEEAAAAAATAVDRVEALTVDNASQQTRSHELRRAVADQLDVVWMNLDADKDNGAAGRARVASGAMRPMFVRTRTAIAAMRDVEVRLLDERAAEAERASRVASRVFAAVNVLDLFVLAGLFWLTATYLKKREAVRLSLRQVHATLGHPADDRRMAETEKERARQILDEVDRRLRSEYGLTYERA